MALAEPEAIKALQNELQEREERSTPAAIMAARAALAAAVGTPEESSATFSLAQTLVCAPTPALMREGIALFGKLVLQGFRPSDSLLESGIGLLRAGDYAKCRTTLTDLVRAEPGNDRACAVLALLAQRVPERGRHTLLIALSLAGALVLVGAATYMLWRRSGPAPQPVIVPVRLPPEVVAPPPPAADTHTQLHTRPRAPQNTAALAQLTKLRAP